MVTARVVAARVAARVVAARAAARVVAARVAARVGVAPGQLVFAPPHSPRPRPPSPTAVRRYWWHEVTAVPTAVPTGDAQQSEAEGGEARPSCGLTASINYFFAPYYRKLSGECLPTSPFPWCGCARGWLPPPQIACADLRTFAHESLYDFLRSTTDARSATHPDRWRKTSSASRDTSNRDEL